MRENLNILLTGANGFVGSKLAAEISKDAAVNLISAVRRRSLMSNKNCVEIRGLSRNTDWSAALQNKHIVIHAAARSHVMSDKRLDSQEAYREANVDGTLKLALQAAEAGVQRFIFLSSIKVNGETTDLRQSFTAEEVPFPRDAYGVSKWEAEQGLHEISQKTGLEVVIIRPPLVYGAGVKGNFASMVELLASGVPLPLGAVENKRSLIALDNLVDLIITCIDHPDAGNQRD